MSTHNVFEQKSIVILHDITSLELPFNNVFVTKHAYFRNLKKEQTKNKTKKNKKKKTDTCSGDPIIYYYNNNITILYLSTTNVSVIHVFKKLQHYAEWTKKTLSWWSLCVCVCVCLCVFYESYCKLQEQRSHVSFSALWGMATTSEGLSSQVATAESSYES